MKSIRRVATFILFTSLLFLAACGLVDELPEVALPEGAAETAQAAAQKAGEAAKTAVSQAGDFAQTAAVVATEEGSAALATLRARGTPDVNAIREKFTSILPDDQGNFSVSISDTDINRVLVLRQLITGPDDISPLRDVAIAFTNGIVFLTAEVTLPVKAKLEVSFQPQISDGRLQFDVVTASLGSQEAPQSVQEKAEDVLNSTLSEAAERLPEGFQLRDITVSEGVLTVSGGPGS